MNTDKTKLIWIGKKRYSRDKRDTNRKLLWRNTQFRFLGIEFSVDLSEMINLNYAAAICQTLNAWKSRYLTPIGKLTVLKTLIIPKFNHLFSSLPNPKLEQLTQLNHIMYKFIWNNEPDKVKRSQICKSYNEGGLKMIDLETFIKALKNNMDAQIIFWLKFIMGPYNSMSSRSKSMGHFGITQKYLLIHCLKENCTKRVLYLL